MTLTYDDADQGMMSQLDSDDGVATSKAIRDKWDRALKATRNAKVQYQLNASFYAGQQWLEPSANGSELVTIHKEQDRVRVTDNRILASMRTILAKLQRRQMRFTVPPSDSDDAIQQAAKLSEQILHDVARAHQWEAKRKTANLVALLGGTAVLSLDWDPTLGNPLGENELTGQPYGTGDVVEHVSSIAEVAFEPGTLDPEHARWWIRAVGLPPELVKEMYDLPSAPKTDSTGLGSNFLGDPTSQDNSDITETCLVMTYYERPGPNTEGKMCVVVGDELVHEGPWPFPFEDRLNCVVIRETEIPGRWFGDSVVSSAVGVQLAYNATLSSMIEHVKLAGNARMRVPHSAMELIEELTDTPGEIFPYLDGTDKPDWMAPPQIASFVSEMIPMLRRELDDLLGTQEISRGAAPANAESGLAYQVLTEQADTPLTALAMEHAMKWALFAQMVLEVYGEYVTETRNATVTRGDFPARSVDWTGGDIKGQTRVEVPLDNVMPRSRAGQEAWAMGLWNAQIVTDPQVLAELMDMAERDSFIEALDPDVAKAERENYEMSLGIDREPSDFDDHAKHISTHNRFRKTKEYETSGPEVQELVDNHILTHESMATVEAEKQMMNPVMAGIPQAAEPMGSATNPAPPMLGESVQMLGAEGADPEMEQGADMAEGFEGDNGDTTDIAPSDGPQEFTGGPDI